MERERHPRTPEQAPNLNWPALLDEALTAPGRLGDTYNRFYQYSFQNQILLLSQGVMEPVATYNRWKDMGRQVKKGARAKSVLRPILARKEEDMDEQQVRGFKMQRCLFGVSDTEGEPLPPFEAPDWSPQGALETLWITEQPFDQLNGNIQGVSYGRNVAINPVAVYPAKTLVHEIAHVLLGHTSEAEEFEYQQHRGLKEFEAETSAYLLMHEICADDHMDAAESRAYVQGWLHGEVPPEDSIKRVFRTVDKILRAGRSAE